MDELDFWLNLRQNQLLPQREEKLQPRRSGVEERGMTNGEEAGTDFFDTEQENGRSLVHFRFRSRVLSSLKSPRSSIWKTGFFYEKNLDHFSG